MSLLFSSTTVADGEGFVELVKEDDVDGAKEDESFRVSFSFGVEDVEDILLSAEADFAGAHSREFRLGPTGNVCLVRVFY
jgi:hypothetical protein